MLSLEAHICLEYNQATNEEDYLLNIFLGKYSLILNTIFLAKYQFIE
jgi:hypothetical protein